MSTPLVPTYRIELPITVVGLTHKVRQYVQTVTPGGIDFQVNNVQGIPGFIDWQDAAQGLADSLQQMYDAGTTLGQAALQHLTGVSWNPISFFTPTWTPALTGPALGWQATAVFRDVDFHKVKVVLLEGGFDTLYHAPSYPTIDPIANSVIKQWTSAFTILNAPWNWVVGRKGVALPANGLAGWTIATNRATRRARGLS